MSSWHFTGMPLVTEKVVYICASKSTQNRELSLLLLDAKDGKLQKSVAIGTHAVDPNQSRGERSTVPSMCLVGDRLYLDTHAGALVSLQAGTGVVDWGVLYESPTQQQNYYYYEYVPPQYGVSGPLFAGGMLFAKGMRSPRLMGLRPDGPTVGWNRPVAERDVLVGADDDCVYLGGNELTAYSLQTQELLWATPPAAVRRLERAPVDEDQDLSVFGAAGFTKSTSIRAGSCDCSVEWIWMPSAARCTLRPLHWSRSRTWPSPRMLCPLPPPVRELTRVPRASNNIWLRRPLPANLRPAGPRGTRAMKLRSVFACLFLGSVAMILAAPPAAAQIYSTGAPSDGITVSGTGEVAARPNLVEIDLQVSGKAELTGDALVKYRDAKQRVLDALAKLKLENMNSSEHGLSISVGGSAEQQQRVINGMMQNAGKNQVDVSSVVRVRFNNVRDVPPEELIKTIGRLLDAAHDAGIDIGPNAADMMRAYRYGQALTNNLPVRFVLSDLSELREAAYEKAVHDARDRATRLAKLHQVKLGSALSIQETLVSGDNPTVQQVYQPYQQNSTQPLVESDGPRIVSSSLAPVPVQVKLMVRFAIVQPEPATAQK